MKTSFIVTGAVVALGILVGGAGIESAYAAQPVTCGQYMKMSHARQRAAFARVKAAMPTPSLVTSTTTTSSGKSAENTPTRPINSGAVVAACQAASPSSTVADAIRHTMSNTTTSTPN